MPGKVEWGSPYDSGYASDIIHEEQEEEYESDETLSPRACRVPRRNWPTVSRQSSSSTHRSQRRDSTWSPNLKQELTRQDSATSSVSTNKDDAESHSSGGMSPLDRSASPVSRTSTPERKNSTLLHPSSPVESFTNDQYTREFTMGPALSAVEMANNNSRVTIIAISEPARSETPVLLHPRLPPRKPSTLLHPSPPIDGSSDVPSVTTLSLENPDADYPFPVVTHTPPTPLPTETKFQRRVSVIHSALSEDEWEDPLHSSQSDADSDSEDDDVKSLSSNTGTKLPNKQDANRTVSVAKSARKARASRISFHGQNLRVVAD